MTHLIESYGLIILFVIVALESSGVPVPGETALITTGVLASQGHFSIQWVIVIAAAAAIIGDNIGYWIGREGGARILNKWAFTRRMRDKYMPPAQRFFEKHGGKTIFVARFVAVLRVFGAWIAGITHMPWWRFLLWNAAGGICWALLVGLISYYLGHAAADAIQRWGLIGGGVAAALAILLVVGFHYMSKRVVREDD
ncbi:MAG: DedA family protein [Actinobacteria bacterium]|nr:DedA family protein [Actinomycetota bacterium]